MPQKIGRNAPCPCGSGKKYKKCCLTEDEKPTRESRAESPAGGGGVARALSWLAERYHVESIEALEQDYYSSLTEDAREAIEGLPDDLYEIQRINAFEWLIAEGTLAPDNEHESVEPIRFVDLVLSENGPLLDVEDREHLRRLGDVPLKLYEIVDVEPGEGLWLSDALSADAKEFFVLERSSSRTLLRGDALGARVMPGDPAVLSGAIYPFRSEWFLALRQTILTGPRGGRRRKIDRGLVTRAIIGHWLERLVQPPPTLVDTATGDPILLTTVHYRVRDWARVEAVLKANPLVAAADDDAWSFFESGPADEGRRILWTVTRLRKKKEDRIEVFARTAGRADEAERWLTEHAGDALEKIARELSDPAHTFKDSPSEPSASPFDAMSPAESAEFARQIQQQIYRNWDNEPIPMLGNKSPKQAMRSKAGRRDVVQLLKSYETQEERRARAEGSPAFDFEFLWKKLGMSREKELG